LLAKRKVFGFGVDDGAVGTFPAIMVAVALI
jgi:hypothetical protein